MHRARPKLIGKLLEYEARLVEGIREVGALSNGVSLIGKFQDGVNLLDVAMLQIDVNSRSSCLHHCVNRNKEIELESADATYYGHVSTHRLTLSNPLLPLHVGILSHGFIFAPGDGATQFIRAFRR